MNKKDIDTSIARQILLRGEIDKIFLNNSHNCKDNEVICVLLKLLQEMISAYATKYPKCKSKMEDLDIKIAEDLVNAVTKIKKTYISNDKVMQIKLVERLETD